MSRTITFKTLDQKVRRRLYRAAGACALPPRPSSQTLMLLLDPTLRHHSPSPSPCARLPARPPELHRLGRGQRLGAFRPLRSSNSAGRSSLTARAARFCQIADVKTKVNALGKAVSKLIYSGPSSASSLGLPPPCPAAEAVSPLLSALQARSSMTPKRSPRSTSRRRTLSSSCSPCVRPSSRARVVSLCSPPLQGPRADPHRLRLCARLFARLQKAKPAPKAAPAPAAQPAPPATPAPSTSAAAAAPAAPSADASMSEPAASVAGDAAAAAPAEGAAGFPSNASFRAFPAARRSCTSRLDS